MKTPFRLSIIWCLCLTMLTLLSVRCCGDIVLEWDDNDNAAGDIVGYKVFYGLQGQEKTEVGTIGKSYVFDTLASGKYEIYVVAMSKPTAANPSFASPPSDLLTFVVPAAPKNLRLRIALETSGDLVNWTTVAVYTIDDAAVREFVRLVPQP